MSEKKKPVPCEFDPDRTCPEDGYPTKINNGYGGNRMYACIACSVTRAAKAIESLRNP